MGAEDIAIRLEATNRGSEARPLHLLPTLWFRNSWSWGYDDKKPSMRQIPSGEAFSLVQADHDQMGSRWLYCQVKGSYQNLLFTENETNQEALFGVPNASPYVKDAFHHYIIDGKTEAINPERVGTKAAVHYQRRLEPGETWIIHLRLSDDQHYPDPFGSDFDHVFLDRQQEADQFYQAVASQYCSGEKCNVQRQAFAGLLWTKQYYHFVIEDWIKGDPAQPQPQRENARNQEWEHFFNDDIISMPDKWEFPCYAAWDLAFHVLPLAIVDPDFTKRQMDRLTREWYMHPNGKMPAYEWHFSDVNPPVHAWGTWRVYQIEQEIYGSGDTGFLERVFQKLLLNFTWWVNRKDSDGNNVFEGGFLGLDNIGVFDRSSELPTGGFLEQSDGTSWMAMYSLNMLTIALELAKTNSAYEDIASKFFEHFLYITDAMNHLGDEVNLWDDNDQFYYDVLHTPNDERHHLKVRSMVGLIPLFAVTILEAEVFEQFPGFARRYDWFMHNRPH
ncbi:MAG: glucosidase, partial [Cyanophyceae cyanobacterium]